MGTRTKKAKTAVLAAIGLLSMLLSACSFSFPVGGFDADGYVKSVLDSLYRGEHEEYMGFTEYSEEEAELNHDSLMEAKAVQFLAYCGLDSVSDDVVQETADMLENVFQNARYEVQGSEKVEDGYAVDVSVTPTEITSENLADIGDAIDAFLESADYTAYTEDQELYDDIAMVIVDQMNSMSGSLEYGGETTVTVMVSETEDGGYIVDQNSLSRIDEMVLGY